MSALAASASDSFQRIGAAIPQTIRGTHATVHVDVRNYSDVWVPNVGSTKAIKFSGPRQGELSSEYRHNLATGAGVVERGLGKGDSYTIEATIPRMPPQSTLRSATAAGPPQELTNSPLAAASIAARWAGDGRTPYATLESVAKHLGAGSYSDGRIGNSISQPGHGQRRLQDFLTARQLVGDDEQYAATFAVMANTLGYPTRVVLGATPEADGTVKGIDVHAWGEVDLTGVGWVPFDVTPPKNRRPNPVPPQVLTVNRSQARLPRRLRVFRRPPTRRLPPRAHRARSGLTPGTA